MIRNLYVIHDKVAEESGPIFEAKNDGIALRQFMNISEKETKHPEDYKLLRVGTYDHELNSIQGELLPVEVTVNMSTEVEE